MRICPSSSDIKKHQKKAKTCINLYSKSLNLQLKMSSKLFFFRIFDNETNQISELFYELHVDQNFKPNLCNDFLIHYNHLQNIVICDRNFITLLSLFLMDFNDPQEAYIDLLKTSKLTPEKFRQVGPSLLQSTLLGNIELLNNGISQLYKGKGNQKQYHSNKSMQLIFNFMSSLFGSLGIDEIFSSFQEIVKFFDYKSDSEFLICRIAQTDYDLIQQLQKGLNTLFKTIYFAQSIYQENDLRKLLKNFNYESSLDLQQVLLVTCEIIQDNEQQLQLKSSLLPVQYEPIIASLVVQEIISKYQEEFKYQLYIYQSFRIIYIIINYHLCNNQII
ncbi:unnamed protein product [Paramecium octaurelia]|uniref:Uncharacterized protein n=1 Tax=Paramecium octaurelia TaxID=43137 RepID=A0A8S1YKI0_PAROT|nr:unnamed protein product [Paramecium octaurelia]